MTAAADDREPMLKESHSSNSSFARLDLDGHAARPAMRNWPLFVFLTGLVFFFYLFYVWQATNTELSMKQEQLHTIYQQSNKQKTEIIDLKADLEKAQSQIAESKTLADTASSKYDECQSTLRNAKLNSETLNSEKSALDTANREREQQLTETKDKLAVIETNYTSLKALYETQSTMAQQLNSTVQALQAELAALRSGANVVATNPPAQQPGVVQQDQGAPQQIQPALTTVPAVNNVPADGVVLKNPADLNELIKQETPVKSDKKTGEEPAPEDKAAIENGEKPDPNAKPEKPDALKDDIREDGEVVDAKEDKETMKEDEEDPKDAIDAPGRPGDRVKMEEGLMEAKGVEKGDKLEDNKPAVQGGDYVDKDDAAADAKAEGAIDAPVDKQ